MLKFYCPNPDCPHHTNPNFQKFWVKNGFLRRSNQKVQRYRCTNCKKNFCADTFTLDYRHRKRGLFENVFNCSTQGLSNRSIARNLKISETSVRRRLKHLSRQALLKWESLSQKIEVKEDLAFDGFETFVYSQFDVNNINHLIGKKSLFLYDFNYVHLNRKGRMTKSQKEKLKDLEEKRGRYCPRETFNRCEEIFFYWNKTHSSSVLYTDEHKAYKRVWKKLKSPFLAHKKINSREHRGSSNPLFPVNHMDMKLRNFLKSCTRETIAFNKNEMGLMDRYILFGALKNFLRPKFLGHGKKKVEESPAMHLKLADKVLSFGEFFSMRMTKFQVKLREGWKEFYTRKIKGNKIKTVHYFGV